MTRHDVGQQLVQLLVVPENKNNKYKYVEEDKSQQGTEKS